MTQIYYSDFYGTDQTHYRLEIFKEGYTGEASEILLAEDPITIEYSLEEILKPTKLSGCTIKVLTPIILKELYTGKVLDVRIDIYKEGELFWTGFNSPNIYDSEWLTDYDYTEINGIDTLSALQYLKYETDQSIHSWTFNYNTIDSSSNFSVSTNIYTDGVLIPSLTVEDDLITISYYSEDSSVLMDGSYGFRKDDIWSIVSGFNAYMANRYGSYKLWAEVDGDNITFYCYLNLHIGNGSQFEVEGLNFYKTKSLYDIITDSLDKVNESGLIEEMIYMNSLDNYSNLLEKWLVQERTFFDELENPITLLDTFEHICQFLGVTITQWKNKYYILEINKGALEGEATYITYDLSDNTYEFNYGSNFINLARVGEENASISLGDVYNRIRVLGNLLEYDESLIPSLTDESNYEPLSDVYSEFVGIYDEDWNRYSWNFYSNNKIWIDSTDFVDWASTGGGANKPYCGGINCLSSSYPSYKKYLLLWTDLIPLMTVFSRYATYGRSLLNYKETFYLDEAYNVPANLSFTDVLSFRLGEIEINYPYGIDSNYKVKWQLALGTGNTVAIWTSDSRVYPKDGAFVISMTSQLSSTLNPEVGLTRRETLGDSVTENYNQYYNDFCSWAKPSESDELKWITSDVTIPCIIGYLMKLKIGDYYWNGESWTTTESYFTVYTEPLGNEDPITRELNLWNFNFYHLRLSSTAEGYCIPLTQTIEGDMELTLTNYVIIPKYGSAKGENEMAGWSSWDEDIRCEFCHVKSLNIEYATPVVNEYALDINESEDADILYSNDIDLRNVSEFNDITLYLNTYNPLLNENMSYSYVFDENMNFVLTVIKDGYILRPEEHLVKMYVDHYSTPKIIYSNILKNDGYKPIDGVYVESLGDTLAIGSISYDLQFNTVDLKAYEL